MNCDFIRAADDAGMLRGTDSAQRSFWSSETEKEKTGMSGMEAESVPVRIEDLREAVRYLKDYYMSNVRRGEDGVAGGLGGLKSFVDRLSAVESRAGRKYCFGKESSDGK